MSELIRQRIDRLENAIALGVLEVEDEGKRLRYRNYDDMRRTLADLKRQLEPAERPSFIRFSTSKGL
jgi:hypothetical protein